MSVEKLRGFWSNSLGGPVCLMVSVGTRIPIGAAMASPRSMLCFGRWIIILHPPISWRCKRMIQRSIAKT